MLPAQSMSALNPMKRTTEIIEAGLNLFQQILTQTPGIAQEFELSRLDFQAALPADEEEAALARRRHFEWYLLERESKLLDGVPAEVHMETWVERAEAEFVDIGDALLHSFAGVFEVSASDQAQGLWLSDLFALGEYPVEGGEHAAEILAGDLVVGRIFPVGDGIYSLSSAASLYREPKLIKAVRRDLASLRESRRGVMRIGQQELERLFFEISTVAEGDRAAGIDLSIERAKAKRALLEAGLEDGMIVDVMIEVTKASASEDASAVTRILNAIAFEDQVDLGLAHRTLTHLWAAEQSPHAKAEGELSKRSSEHAAQKAEDVRNALARFDELRAAGADVEELYDQLAQRLGITDSDEDSEVITLPDFPGVVSAVIEEFLWDVERVQGAPRALSLGRIRLLGEYGKEIGVFEELGKAQVLDYAGRWLLDEGQLGDAEDARACLVALREFCSWSQEQHCHPLSSECDSFLAPLDKSIPRLVLLRRTCAGRAEGDKPFDVKEVKAAQVLLVDEDQREHEAHVLPKQAELLRTGDLVHGRLVDGRLEIAAAYPQELRLLLDFKS